MGRFVIRQTPKGFKFDLLAANGQVIASSEVYGSKAACRKGIDSVAKCAAKARTADLTGTDLLPANPRFELYQDKSGQFRFRMKARNGKVIAVSEGYSSRFACENGIESVIKNASQQEE